MKLTKNEIQKYVFTILILGAIPILYSVASLFVPVSWVDYDRGFFMEWHSTITWISLAIANLVTVFYINLSERRIGNNDNIIWQLLGLVLGFMGFVGYALWGVLNQTGLFQSEEEEPVVTEEQ